MAGCIPAFVGANAGWRVWRGGSVVARPPEVGLACAGFYSAGGAWHLGGSAQSGGWLPVLKPMHPWRARCLPGYRSHIAAVLRRLARRVGVGSTSDAYSRVGAVPGLCGAVCVFGWPGPLQHSALLWRRSLTLTWGLAIICFAVRVLPSGKAVASQATIRGFESHHPLSVFFSGRAVRSRWLCRAF